MKHLSIYIFMLMMLVSASLGAKQWQVSELPNVQLQDHTKHLVNPDGIISGPIASQIDSLLLDGRRKSSAEIVAVVVDDIDRDDIDSYATELFNTWGIGKSDKNNGILLIVAKDSHQATIRTGYGSEGILPDILAGRIVYDEMIPYFRQDDYDGGVLAGVKGIHRLVTDPEAVAELMSQERDNYHSDDEAILKAYLWTAVFVAIGLMTWLVYMLLDMTRRNGKMSDYQKCQYLKKYQLIFWVISLIFVGIPILAPIIMTLLRHYYRNHSRKCPHCGTKMQKLGEEEDNKYLTYAQDLEERINSVDYDVWLCPHCKEKDIYSFVNSASNYRECPKCHARTEKLTSARIIREPSYTRAGEGEKVYSCLNCGNQHGERYTIPKKEKPVVVVGAGGFGRGGGGFGSGGFGGGFGGGLTGGGGATGRW